MNVCWQTPQHILTMNWDSNQPCIKREGESSTSMRHFFPALLQLPVFTRLASVTLYCNEPFVVCSNWQQFLNDLEAPFAKRIICPPITSQGAVFGNTEIWYQLS